MTAILAAAGPDHISDGLLIGVAMLVAIAAAATVAAITSR